jgi:hypothetical protein
MEETSTQAEAKLFLGGGKRSFFEVSEQSEVDSVGLVEVENFKSTFQKHL